MKGNSLKKNNRNPLRMDIPFYILLLPALLLVIIFKYIPMSGLLLAFKDYVPKEGIYLSPWTDSLGFGNFIRLFQTPEFLQAIWNTLYFNVITMLFEFPAPIILALLFNEMQNKHFKKVAQTISFMPHFLSVAAVTGIVNALLSRYGTVNSILELLGVEGGQNLLEDPNAFLPIYVVSNVWKSVGWGTLVYLAALCSISEEVYEAAELDGAGRFKQTIYITLPSLLPTISILLIMRMGTLFGSSFEMVYGLQNPIGWTDEVIATAVYKYGLTRGQYAMSTALSLMQGAIALILTFGTNFISKKVSNISMW